MKATLARRAATTILAACSGILASDAHPDHGTELEQGLPIPVAALAEPAAKPANSVKITIEGDFRRIQSNGWPDHAPGEFPRRGNPNAPTPQKYSFRVPVKPVAAESPQRRGGWWWGVALNGVPFEPGTGETWNNDPRSGWRYEAATGFLNLGLDQHHAHVQPNGAYHYHALPTGLVEGRGGDGKKMLLIGWSADGFPVSTGMAHADAKEPKSALRKMKSGYQLKKGPRPEQENGPGGNHDGRFSQDFEFVKGLGDLDECNGRCGVTPEFPEGTYYYSTASAPSFPSSVACGTAPRMRASTRGRRRSPGQPRPSHRSAPTAALGTVGRSNQPAGDHSSPITARDSLTDRGSAPSPRRAAAARRRPRHRPPRDGPDD